MENLLQVYFNLFSRLKRASINGARAPHKPILLLSVVQLMDEGQIKNNQIYITAELVARFKDNWNLYVNNTAFRPNFYLPFFHLRVHYFDKYNVDSVSTGIIHEIEKQILHDSPATYRQYLEGADEEDIFIRSAVFKKEIPRIYNHTCCISGLQIITGYNIQMVDACHIVPFAVSHDDTITNGLSLSPNLHRAFDRGLISVDENYMVRVSAHITEPDYANNLRSFAGKQLLLPVDKPYLPEISNLQWHTANIFKQ